MLFSTELFSLPLDWNIVLYGAGFAVAGLASVYTHKPDESEENSAFDEEAVKCRVVELEKLSSRSLEQNDELAALYCTWAFSLFERTAEMDEITSLFAKAEGVLKATLAQGDDDEIRRQLGTVYLNWAVVLQDCDDWESAIELYQKGIDVLKPLDNSGDVEAKYDTAGIKLNLGIIYRELGNFDKACTMLDESFLAYRAVEKIGVAETRLFMAKVSVQQGNIFFEMGEPLEKIIDAYNRAMRLYVEVIEDVGTVELERELANVLLDRCMATYENSLDGEFESEEKRDAVIDGLSLDLSRGVELLEKQYQSGNILARLDLFHAVSLQGKILCDELRFTEAKQSLDKAVNEFSDLCEDDDVLLMQMAIVYVSRAIAHLGLGDKGLSEQDCTKGSELVNQLLQLDSDDEDILEIKEQFQTLLDQLK